jgi:hypothetical protein
MKKLDPIGVTFFNADSFKTACTKILYKNGAEEWGQPLVLSNYTKASHTTFTVCSNPLQQTGTLYLQSDQFAAIVGKFRLMNRQTIYQWNPLT